MAINNDPNAIDPILRIDLSKLFNIGFRGYPY